ncbi:MAG: carboxypeptidase-like regulatory domain-containing protein [Pirellulales bacterium]
MSLVLACAALSMIGCGSGHLPELGTVSGIVTLDGQPLEGATVQFTPSLGRVSRARTGSDGAYELRYVGSERGALLGEHKVMIITSWMDEDPATGRITNHPEKLPPKYHAESELKRTVEAGDNRFDFATTSK